MSLRVYTGEFLVSPVPLHLDLNRCSHGCFYCFATLNNPNRRFDGSFLRQLVRSLTEHNLDDQDPCRWLAVRGYPALASNTVDPFAKSNAETFISLYETLTPLGFNWSYQTRGGECAAIELALSGKPTMWYVSLTSDNEAFLREAEPAAPTYRQRLELIAEIKRHGHHLVAGINPFVPDWWLDTDRLLYDLLDANVTHIWVQPLHLSRFQVAAMTPHTKQRFGEWVQYGLKKLPPDAGVIAAWCDDARAAGIRVFGDADSPFDFWDAYFELGYPFWPTLTGWFKHLTELGGGKPVMFGVENLAAWCDVGLPKDKGWYKEFVQPFGRSIRNLITAGETWRKAHECPRDILGVLRAYWQIFDYPTRLVSPYIALAGEHTPNGLMLYEDELGELVYVFVPSGWEPEVFDVVENETLTYCDLIGR